MAQLRSAAAWLKVLDQAEDWHGSFKDYGKRPHIEFGEISEQSQADGMGEGRGWDGSLIVPRAVAIDMMAWLAQRARDELARLGVKA